jgi:hypothetical protein
MPLVGGMKGWKCDVVVEVDPPGQRARRQRPILGVVADPEYAIVSPAA